MVPALFEVNFAALQLHKCAAKSSIAEANFGGNLQTKIVAARPCFRKICLDFVCVACVGMRLCARMIVEKR